MQDIVYHKNYELEESYWWFVARNAIILDMLKSKTKLARGAKVLDVGCGTGGFAMLMLKDFDVTCSDMSPIALDYCARRGIKNSILGTLDDIPRDMHPKAITMLDVVEHIPDDKQAVRDVYEILPEGGWYIASVPAYQWLWSHHDVIHKHFRRYTKSEFNEMLSSAGFEIVYTSYFQTFLFPLAVIKRFADRITGAEKKQTEPVEELPGFMNSLFKAVFKAEKGFLKFMRFPFGNSIITIARKPAK